MNIVIATSSSIPYGLALSNRILSFAKGFQKNGHNCEILILNPTEKDNRTRNRKPSGFYENIKYRYACKSTIIPSSRILKVLIFFKSIFSSIYYLNKKNENNKIDVILIFHTYSIYLFLISIYSKIKKIKIIHERNEYPFIGIKNVFKKLDYFFYCNVVIKIFDGYIFITKELEKYFKNYLNLKKPSIIIPILVEPERFKNRKNNFQLNFNYLAYCGYLWGDKDGVDILVEAFSNVLKIYSDLKLFLIGDISNQHEFKKLFDRLEKLGISNNVVFTGKVSRDEMPYLLYGAKLLLLSRPDNVQAKGGFPTKLGEYLATGKPVVVTRVGEIPYYLKDRVNAFLAKPDSSEAFANKILEALNDYNFAKKIGENGKKLSMKEFNYIFQTKRLISFFNTI
ncbi:glycosyl transferase group 1 [Caldithrix abyssi DSM 13497]|uniref:Glycosyl transferase group 1 n=1 Tax=Caldithrix abyssi DSM 13497 TaxID=880073 RepID=H1XS40_CALAY|nr:glycosyltransferase [Caldithrix abyssi]APF20143.1 Glycosyltransferase involved in cell wall bisynthesis [Caldithrix abyssi DSM 13497]EHO40204.1 glycosyl transferase group 1 [Caldithrix abyssi DSM 13497]